MLRLFGVGQKEFQYSCQTVRENVGLVQTQGSLDTTGIHSLPPASSKHSQVVWLRKTSLLHMLRVKNPNYVNNCSILG